MISDNYGLYLINAIGFVWVVGVSCFIIDIISKPKKNSIIKKTKKPSYNSNAKDSFVIIDDVSFPN